MKESVLYIENQLFPPITYMSTAIKALHLQMSPYDRYSKMGFRNRYRILDSNGVLTQTVPLAGGRNKQQPAGMVCIDYSQPWQVRHWRTLVSCYNRSPFFLYYEPALQQFFERRFERLWDMNLEAWNLLGKMLKHPWEIKTMEKHEAPAAALINPIGQQLQPYQQVFGTHFHPDLSVLDLIFNMGPSAREYLLNQPQTGQ